MKRVIFFTAFSFLINSFSYAQNVGIGTASPLARLHVIDSSVLFSASGIIPGIAGGTPISGGGRRLLWYPDKAAFRVGYVSGANWNKDSIGNYSIAAGYDTKALSPYSTAMGFLTNAKGISSTAMGSQNIASGSSSTAMGSQNTASGNNSTAIGYQTHAIGYASTASGSLTYSGGDYSTSMGLNTQAYGTASTSFGYQSFAGGDYSTAMGTNTYAGGTYATAMGANTYASGIYSTAMGAYTNATDSFSTAMGYGTNASGKYSTAMGYYASTNSKKYSFAITASGLGGNPSITNENDNEFMVYAEHYKFWTGTAGTFVNLIPGSNSWTGSCDKNKKENFVPLNGEEVLYKISKINFSSWNYKNQSPKTFRHYGIMAQDFYSAFGKDKYGIIGCDTLVNPLDMIGIDMAAIKALELRTQRIEDLEKKNELMVIENAVLKQTLVTLTRSLTDLKKEVELLAKKENLTTTDKGLVKKN